jgi:hypothetical protein
MLRIKEGIDLKELEKFGFVEKRKYFRKENVAIEKETREILIQASNYCPYGDRKPLNNKNGLMIYIDNILYDLIRAYIVERVEE